MFKRLFPILGVWLAVSGFTVTYPNTNTVQTRVYPVSPPQTGEIGGGGGGGSGDIESVSAGSGMSGGGIAGAVTLNWDPGTQTASITIWDGANATRTLTYNINGTDPVWTIGSNSVDLTTGVLKQGGVAVQLQDAEITALAGLVSAADKLPYFTGSGTGALADLSAFIRTLLDDPAAVNARATLGLEIGVNVQSFHDNLQDIADFTPTDDTIIVGNGNDYESKALPDCQDTAGKHLNYTAASNTISCGTSGGGSISGLTTNAIPKAASPTTLADSSITEDGDSVNSSKPIEIGNVSSNSFGFNGADVTGTSGNDIYVPDNGSTAVVGTTSTANQFLTHVSTLGVQNKAQPSFSNLSGTASVAQIPNAVKDDTKNFTILTPTTADTNKIQIQFAAAVTLQEIGCSTDTGTMSIQVDKRSETTPNSAGTNALTSTLVCDSDRQESSTFTSAGVAANQVLNVQITATASTPGVGRVHITVRPD